MAAARLASGPREGPSSTPGCWAARRQTASWAFSSKRRRSWWPFWPKGSTRSPLCKPLPRQSRPPDPGRDCGPVPACGFHGGPAVNERNGSVPGSCRFLQQTPSKSCKAAGEHTEIRVFSRSNHFIEFFKKRFCSRPACKSVRIHRKFGKNGQISPPGAPAGGRARDPRLPSKP